MEGGRREGEREEARCFSQTLLSSPLVMPFVTLWGIGLGHIALLFYLFASGSHVAQTSLEFTV